MDKTGGHESALIDVSSATMLELLVSREPAITQAVRKLLQDRQGPRDILLGWNSTSVTPPVNVDSTQECRGEPAP